METDITTVLDIWSRMEMLNLKIPEEEFAKQKRCAQTKILKPRKMPSECSKWIKVLKMGTLAETSKMMELLKVLLEERKSQIKELEQKLSIHNTELIPLVEIF